MKPASSDPFFVGYFKKVPVAVRNFALLTGIAIVGGPCFTGRADTACDR